VFIQVCPQVVNDRVGVVQAVVRSAERFARGAGQVFAEIAGAALTVTWTQRLAYAHHECRSEFEDLSSQVCFTSILYAPSWYTGCDHHDACAPMD
jgi:hypothetical protein